MIDSDCEIEYLDEDADIVEQIVQIQPSQNAFTVTVKNERLSPLLVEREKPVKRKRIKKEYDSDYDYDPSEDIMVPSPPSPKTSSKPKKRKAALTKKLYKPEKSEPELNFKEKKKLSFKKVMRENRILSGKEEYEMHKNFNIRIPDFGDPLCLPVKAIQNDINDCKRLETWNNVCLEHFKHCDSLLQPDKGETKSSIRTVVLRNVINKQIGRKETTIWNKTCVVNEFGDKKSEIFQCVLPNYQEKKMLHINLLPMYNKLRTFHTTEEVILRKEDQDNQEILVAYKPRAGISSVYTLVDKRDKVDQDNEDTNPQEHSQQKKDEEEVKMYLRELTCCRMCVRCFQESWRGLKKINGPVICPICSRSFTFVHSMLLHVKMHSTSDVKRYKRVISLILSDIVEYHYKCRLCREKCTSIKESRKHVSTHRGTEMFLCEVGNHWTR